MAGLAALVLCVASPALAAQATGAAGGVAGPTAPVSPAAADRAASARIVPTPGQPTIPFVNLSVRQPQSGQEVSFSLQLLLLITVLTLAPSILLLMTSFLRISIVLDFIKRALSLQQMPPNQVLMGIALFMTLFIMWPQFDQINQKALQPLAEGKINVETAYKEAEQPLRLFMYRQMQGSPENIRLFMSMAGLPKPNTLADVPTWVLAPAFILNELTVAFKIGILLYIPFIVIDMVVASILMSMGMIMLPPVMISTPFKIMLFVLVDGWGLLTQQLVRSFG